MINFIATKLQAHPIYGFASGMLTFITGRQVDAFMEITTPFLTWLGLLIGVLIALATLILKIKELIQKWKG